MARSTAAVRRRCRPVRARWSWPGTTPARRRAASPRPPAGRSWPSRRAVHAPGSTRSVATGCCSVARWAEEIERVVVFGHPTLSRPVSRLLGRADVEVWAAKPAGLGLDRPYPVAGTFDRVEAADARRHRLVPALARGGRAGRARPRRAARRRARPDAVRRRGCGRAGAAARGPARRRRVEPDPRPRPDGAALPGRCPPQGDRQPRPVRHRRRGVDRGRRRARPRRPTAASRCSAT